MPSWPPSRPRPDSFTPPNGAAAAVGLMSLTPTMPKRSASIARQRPAQVVGVDVAGQAVVGVVGHGDHLVLGVEGDDGRDRAEGLLAVDDHVGRDAGEHGRRVEAAVRQVALARGGWPPVTTVAPLATASRTWRSTLSSGGRVDRAGRSARRR